MGYAADIMTIPNGLNRRENHAAIERAFRIGIPQAAKAGVPNVIAFSGNCRGMSDAEGADNAVAGLNRVKKIAEDYDVTICVELLNSKVDHPDYMADHTAWGVRVAKEVASPHVKLLYDIYHMQIMEGDLIDTIRQNIQWIGHFHTGGVPGRHNLDDTQEVNWHAVARSIADLDFQGFFAHEFVPVGDPLAALRRRSGPARCDPLPDLSSGCHSWASGAWRNAISPAAACRCVISTRATSIPISDRRLCRPRRRDQSGRRASQLLPLVPVGNLVMNATLLARFATAKTLTGADISVIAPDGNLSISGDNRTFSSGNPD